MKYLTNKESISEAKAQETYPSPQVLRVVDNDDVGCVIGNVGIDKSMVLNGDSLDELNFEEKKTYEYLTFTSQQNGSTISYALTGSPSITVSYSSDNGSTWNNLIGTTVTLNAGDSIIVKGKISTAPATSKYGNFVMTGKIAASGSVMSLQNEEPGEVSITYSYEFYKLFYNCSSLTTAPELPATTLAVECYEYMFRGCSSLTTAPELPATTLSTYCYVNMFYGCTSLTTAPSLPATTLVDGCYMGMFIGCSSLTTAPSLPATTLARKCYSEMFMDCSNLTTAPSLPATTLARSCYEYMFYSCTSLTTAPELPAKTLAEDCYGLMFCSCSSLTSVIHHVVSWNISYATNWLSNVASTGTVTCPSDSTIPTNSTSGIPTGWTRVNL